MKRIVGSVFFSLLACSAHASDDAPRGYLRYALSINEVTPESPYVVTPAQGMAQERHPLVVTLSDANSIVSACGKTGLSIKDGCTGYTASLIGAPDPLAPSKINVQVQLDFKKLLSVERTPIGECVLENPKTGSFTLNNTVIATKGEKILVSEVLLTDNSSNKPVGNKFAIWLTVL